MGKNTSTVQRVLFPKQEELLCQQELSGHLDCIIAEEVDADEEVFPKKQETAEEN